MVKTVIIAEKASLGKDIANGLWATKIWKWYMTDWKWLFITRVAWHFYELKMPQDFWYGWWDVNNLPILPNFNDTISYKIRKEKFITLQSKIIKDLTKDTDIIVSAGDPDREGEALIRLFVKNYLKWLKKWVKFKRIWVKDLNKKEVQKAYKNMEDLNIDKYNNLYHSALWRAWADWLYWMNFSQLYTLKRNKVSWFQKNVISVWRVQTSLLKIIYDREKEIENFKPEKYYQLNSIFKNWIIATYIKKDKKEVKRNFQKEYIEKVYNEIKDEREGKIIDIKEETKKTFNYGLYTKTKLISDIKKIYGKVSVKDIWNIIDDLYEKYKIMSYPRTDFAYINKATFDTKITKVLKELKNNPDFSEHINFLENNNLIKSNKYFVDNKKVGEHEWLHPVIPDKWFTNQYNSLPEMHKNVLKVIILKLLSNMYWPYITQNTTIFIDIKKHFFTTSWKMEKDLWYKKMYYDLWFERLVRWSKDKKLPNVEKDDILNIKKLEIIEKETQPPSRYSQSGILDIMQDLSKLIEDKELKKTIKWLWWWWNRKIWLGTSATRGEILNKIITNNYVKEDNKVLKISDKWKEIIEIIWNKNIMKFSPVETWNWEEKLNEIKEGKIKLEDFHNLVQNTVKSIVETEKNENNLEKSKIETEEVEEKCPKCWKSLVKKKIFSKKRNKEYTLLECSWSKYNPKTRKKTGCDYVKFL